MRFQKSGPVLRLFVALLAVAVVTTVFAGEEQSFGQGVTGQDTIPITVLLADADEYVDTVVRVEGVITGVCQKRGCWMMLSNDGGEDEIRIKVEDDVIVFPAEAKGRRAIAEGTLTKTEMTLEETVAYKQHHAEEMGEEFDPASVTEPMTYFQIKGTGAVIR